MEVSAKKSLPLSSTTTNAALFRWCLDQGLRVMYLMTLMTIGLYTPPQGAYLPAVTY